MTIKQKIVSVILGGFLALPLFATILTPQQALAVNKCGGVDTAIISCPEDNTTDKNGNGKVDAQETGVWGILILIINIMIAGVAVLALVGIVYGAVLYTSAGGNSEQVKKAMGIFTNVVIGIVAFAGMWVLLNFLIPGGAFTNL